MVQRASFLAVGDAERARILDVARRLGSVRWPATAVVTAALACTATVAGAAIVPPILLYVFLLPLLARLAHSSSEPECVLFGALGLGQLATVASLGLATRWGIEGLGLLVLPVVVASVLFPPRTLIAFVVASVVVLAGAAALIDPQRVIAEPPVLLLPLGVMLCVAVPGAAVRALDETSRGTAIADALTGALNRMALEARISELMSHAQGEQVPVGVIIADLDHFKHVNDELGHDAGDIVLCAAVERMRSQLDRFTPLYRVGGEEFLVLVPGASLDDVAELADQLRLAVCAEPVEGRVVTMSFGVASSTLQGRAFDEVLASADEALYAAKHAGRNRVVRAVGRPTAGLTAVPDPVHEPELYAQAAETTEVVVGDAGDARVQSARELLGNGTAAGSSATNSSAITSAT